MDEAIRTLEARVRGLERRARWSRAAAVAALALVAVSRWTIPPTVAAGGDSGPAAARAPEAELQARRFVLVSADGRPLAALESADGGPRLSLLNHGAARLSLSLAADGSPSLTLAGPGRSRVSLVNDGLAPRLALADSAGNDRLWLALRLNSPVLQFLDAQGRARSGLTTFNDDSGVAVISGTEAKSPGLVLYGKERNIVWSAP